MCFSSAKFCKAFDVSVALHFDFLPPFDFDGPIGVPIPLKIGIDLCAFQRLVRNATGGQYHDYEGTEVATEEMLHGIAILAAAGLDALGQICGDGQPLLELIPPKVLWADIAVFDQLLQASTIEEQNRLSASMRIRQLVPHEWHLHITSTAILLSYLARYYRRTDLIDAYLKIIPMERARQKEAPYIEDLRRRLM